jgi:hypothetical protein
MLDRKLEGRRLEVRTRQEKAKWRLAKLQEEMQLKAQAEGDLTEEEERAMIEKAKNLSQEASELRAEKIRVQAEADAAEAEFHRVRFAAGVPGPGPEATVTEEGAPFAPPEPEPIIQRFAKLEDEVNQIEDQLGDYNARLSVLQQQQLALRAQNQPRARDAQDEESVDQALAHRLAERTEGGRRALETAARELEVARGLRLQLEQSVTVLLDRLDLLALHSSTVSLSSTALSAAAASMHEIAEAESISSALLEQIDVGLPTPWCRALQAKAAEAARRLQHLMRSIDPLAAASALRAAAQHLQLSVGVASAALDDTAAVSKSRTSSVQGALSSASSSDDATTGALVAGSASADAENESDRRLEATIESLIVRNEWSIRVRPGSGAGSSRPVKSISGKLLSEAVQAFEKTWRDVGSGAFNPASAAFGATASSTLASTSGAGDSSDPFSKEASQQRRRNSRIELNAAFAAAAASGGDVVHAHGDEIAAAGAGASAGHGGGKSKKGAQVKEPVDANKPKARDVQKFLATAAFMAGDDVEDALVSIKKDTEEVPTRDKLKKAVANPVGVVAKGKRS